MKKKKRDNYLLLLQYFRMARDVWKEDFETRGLILGMDSTEFDYCVVYADIQFMMTGKSAKDLFTQGDYKSAFEDTK